MDAKVGINEGKHTKAKSKKTKMRKTTPERKKSCSKRLPPLAYSIAEFCAAHRISRAHLYTAIKAGQGPAIMKVGGRRLVSVEAAATWRRKMECGPQPHDNDNNEE